MFYGSEIWGVDTHDEIESVHMYACKRFLGVKQSSSNHVVRGECGRFPMYIYTYKRAIKYWCKITKMPDCRYVKKCYNLLFLDCTNGRTNWVTKVKNILFRFGFGYVWEQQFVNNIPSFISKFESRLKTTYEQDWHASLTLSSKASAYILFKPHFGLENYIHEISISKFRVAFARFRCSSHQLRIETGRFKNEVRSDRLCLVCNQPYVEDEYHFLLVCNVYDNLRFMYIPQKYHVYPSLHKFNMLMSNTNVSTVRNVAMYVYQAMRLRMSHIQP